MILLFTIHPRSIKEFENLQIKYDSKFEIHRSNKGNPQIKYNGYFFSPKNYRKEKLMLKCQKSTSMKCKTVWKSIMMVLVSARTENTITSKTKLKERYF